MPTRRDMFAYLGAGLAAGLGKASVPRVAQALATTQQSAVGDPHTVALDDLHALVEHYKRTFRIAPPTALHDELLAVRMHAGSLLDCDASSRRRPDLVLTVGWRSSLLALVTHDLGDRAATLVWCADAERRSQEAGYPELAGWIAQIRLLMSFYDGRAPDAVVHARRGQQSALFGTVAHAQLIAQEMRAWALLGDAGEVANARRRAEKAISRLPADTPRHGTFSISLTEDPPYTATSLLLLGRHKEAVTATERVMDAFYSQHDANGIDAHPSGFARTYLVLALAYAGCRQVDEACAAGTKALSSARIVWSVTTLARRVDQTLTREFPDTAEARNFHERCVTLLRPSADGYQ